MTRPADSPPGNALYGLLPAIFRQQDIAQGYPLLALMTVFDHVHAELAMGISELEQDWFIETCPLAYVPLIGGLLGLEIANPVRPEHRALVADALAFRRRRGLAAALPRLARDSADWFSLYSPAARTPWPAWPLPDATGEPAADTAGLLRIWRLPVFPVIGATPAPAARDNFYHFNPLGMDQPLFNLPSTPLEWAAAQAMTALPAPLTAAMLAADLTRHAANWPDLAEAPTSSLLYGPARGLVIRTGGSSDDWTALPPGSLRAMSLGGYPPVAPDYPALEGGTIDLASVAAVTADLTIAFGDATARLSLAVPAKPTMPELVALVQRAITAATIVPGKEVSRAAIKALRVGAVGDALVIVPRMLPEQPLSIGPTTPDGANPLLLTGTARLGIAAATSALTPELIALLTGAPQDTAMTFTAPAGQVIEVALPLTLKSQTAVAAARAFAAALPDCFVSDAGDRVVIVPPDAAPQPPVPPTAPAPELGLVPAVAVDPALGLFSWPSAWAAPGALSVDYGIAMPGAIGGIGPRPRAPMPPSAVTLDDGGDPAWLERQLGAWRQSTAASTVLTLQTSATRSIASQQLAPAAGRALWIVGAEGSQPSVTTASPGQLTLLGPSSPAAAGAVVLSGMTLAATIGLLGGEIDLTLLDATLYPGPAAAAIAAAGSAQAAPAAGTATLRIERCLLGPVDLSLISGRIDLDSSVLSTLPAPRSSAEVLTLPADVTAGLTRMTIIGGTRVAGDLRASDSLFDGVLTCSAEARFTDCYVTELHYPAAANAAFADEVPGAVAVSRCGDCGQARALRLRNCLLRQVTLMPGGTLCECASPSEAAVRDCATCIDPACAETCPLRAPGQSWEPVRQPPRFAQPNAYPLPDFARLSDDNPPAILAGASNRDVLGAYNLAVPTARRTQFEAAIRSGLLLGTRLDWRFES